MCMLVSNGNMQIYLQENSADVDALAVGTGFVFSKKHIIKLIRKYTFAVTVSQSCLCCLNHGHSLQNGCYNQHFSENGFFTVGLVVFYVSLVFQPTNVQFSGLYSNAPELSRHCRIWSNVRHLTWVVISGLVGKL